MAQLEQLTGGPAVNGARRALVPLENKRNFLEVSGDIVERVDPVFFSDPLTAAMKALGMN
jgi:ATP-dependent Lon protease